MATSFIGTNIIHYDTTGKAMELALSKDRVSVQHRESECDVPALLQQLPPPPRGPLPQTPIGVAPLSTSKSPSSTTQPLTNSKRRSVRKLRQSAYASILQHSRPTTGAFDSIPNSRHASVSSSSSCTKSQFESTRARFEAGRLTDGNTHRPLSFTGRKVSPPFVTNVMHNEETETEGSRSGHEKAQDQKENNKQTYGMSINNMRTIPSYVAASMDHSIQKPRSKNEAFRTDSALFDSVYDQLGIYKEGAESIRNFSRNIPLAPAYTIGKDAQDINQSFEDESYLSDFDFEEYNEPVHDEAFNERPDALFHKESNASSNNSEIHHGYARSYSSSRVDIAQYTITERESVSPGALAGRSTPSSKNAFASNNPYAGSAEPSIRDHRSVSRLSFLSRLSGTAFVVSEDISGSSGGQSPLRIDNIVHVETPVPRVGVPYSEDYFHPEEIDSNEYYHDPLQDDSSIFDVEQISESCIDYPSAAPSKRSDVYQEQSPRSLDASSSHTSSEERDTRLRRLTPAPLLIHPADERYDQLRRDEDNQPVLVPIYNVPGSHTTHEGDQNVPKFSPKFINNTPRNFEYYKRSSKGHLHKQSTESSQGLISKHDNQERPLSAHSAFYMHHHSVPPSAPSVSTKRPVSLNSVADSHRTHGSVHMIPDPTWGRRLIRSVFGDAIMAGHDIDVEKHANSMLFVDPATSTHTSLVPPPRLNASRTSSQFFSNNVPSLQHVPSMSRYGPPALLRARDAYEGNTIDANRWPDRIERQKRIGRALIIACLLLPPLWLVMAFGGLDSLVSFVTNGEIWSVRRTEKQIAGVLGGAFFLTLIGGIIAIAVVVL